MELRHFVSLSVCLTMAATLSARGEENSVATPMHSPYAGMQSRTVKALSDQEMADLKAGRGMGLAMAAELNGYPGPRHVLDLADQLQLTDRQRAMTQDLFQSMKAETVPIGERIFADEVLLDRLFAEHRGTPGAVSELTARIGAARGALRAAHLRYHLDMMKVLSTEQVARYMMLRGYTQHGHHIEGVH
jgi:hypothetical protein